MEQGLQVPTTRARGWLFLVVLLVFFGAVAAGAWWTGRSLVIAQVVSEGRTVADMAENVGRWASQYGGVHVYTQGASAPLPGNFLTRNVYAGDASDSDLLNGAPAAGSTTNERQALDRIHSYYWKNPALIQREVADVTTSAGSKSQYRLTAQTVLNPSNAPKPFDLEALGAIQAAFEKHAAKAGNNSAHGGTWKASEADLEYWTIRNGQLLYARGMIAQASCLKCHDSPAKAPEFLRTNAQFNGGGGFGYVAGKPAGLISVSVPMPDIWRTLEGSLPRSAWAAAVLTVLSTIALVVLALRRPRA